MIRISMKLEESPIRNDYVDLELSSIMEMHVDIKFGNECNRNYIRNQIMQSYSDFVADVSSKLSVKAESVIESVVEDNKGSLAEETGSEEIIAEAVILDHSDLTSGLASINLSTEESTSDNNTYLNSPLENGNPHRRRNSSIYHKKSPLSYKKGGSRVKITFPDKTVDFRDNVHYPDSYLARLPEGSRLEIVNDK